MFFVVCSEQETPPAQHHLELEGQPLPPSHQRRRVYRLLPPLPQVAMALAAQLHPSQGCRIGNSVSLWSTGCVPFLFSTFSTFSTVSTFRCAGCTGRTECPALALWGWFTRPTSFAIYKSGWTKIWAQFCFSVWCCHRDTRISICTGRSASITLRAAGPSPSPFAAPSPHTGNGVSGANGANAQTASTSLAPFAPAPAPSAAPGQANSF